jgi:hypothetical protein
MFVGLSEKVGQFKGSRSTIVDVEPSKTVLELRELVSKELKVRVNNLIILLDDEFLDADMNLADYGVSETSELTFEIKMCGPVPINRDWGTAGYKRKLTVGAGAASGAAIPM